MVVSGKVVSLPGSVLDDEPPPQPVNIRLDETSAANSLNFALFNLFSSFQGLKNDAVPNTHRPPIWLPLAAAGNYCPGNTMV